jgi:predicted RNA-binding protein YlxR (DUF448 family)
MCIGCRERAPRGQLLRVVASGPGDRAAVVPDPGRRLPGRGASLHRDPACLALAERRRAFARALRHEGALDLRALHALIDTER